MDTRLKMWDVATGNLVWAGPTTQTYSIGQLAFSPDGTRIATANSRLNFSGSVQLFRATDGTLLQTFPENASSIAFSADGYTFVSAGTNIIFRSGADGALLASYPNGTSVVEESVVALAPNGSTFFFAHGRQQLFAARTPLVLHSFLIDPNGWTFRRSGGDGSYQLQIKTNLTDPWQNLGSPSTNPTFSISNQFPNAFFRLISP